MPTRQAPAPPAARVEPAEPFATDRMCRLRHDADRHPLMQLDALRELAHELAPLGGCRFLDPGAGEASAFVHRPESHAGLSIDEVFARIDEPGSWIALYNVERVPRYRRFVEEVVASLRAEVEREQPGIFLVTGFVFVSAPPSVTPYHIDRENNFWLQVRGRKTLTLWATTVTPPAAVEEFIVHRDLGGVRLGDETRARARHFDCGPGDGVYFPATTPHTTRSAPDWVRPGDGVAVSIGINFYTRTTRRHALVHHCNRVLRRLGATPPPPGVRPWLDALKAPFGRAALRFLRWRRPDYVVPPGVRIER